MAHKFAKLSTAQQLVDRHQNLPRINEKQQQEQCRYKNIPQRQLQRHNHSLCEQDDNAAYSLLDVPADFQIPLGVERTDEEQYQVADLQAEYYGRIADYIYQNGAVATDVEMLDFCKKTAQSIAVGYGSTSWKKVEEGGVFAGDTTAKETIDSFNDIQKALVMDDKGLKGAFVRFNKLTGIDADGNGEPDTTLPVWIPIDAGAEQTFKDLAEFEMNQLHYLLGETDTKMEPVVGNENGTPVLVPDIIADAVTYRFRDGNILYNTGDGWEDTGFDIAESEGEMYKNRDKIVIDSKMQELREKQEETPANTYQQQLRDHTERVDARKDYTYERWVPPTLRGGNLKPANMEKF